MVKPTTDEALVARCAAGDQEAFAELVRRYQRRLLGFLVQMVGEPELARDLAQETLFRVWTAASRYDPSYRFTTWLFRIAHNLAVDHLRRRRVTTTPLDVVSRDGEERELPIADPARDPLERLENAELGETLRRAILGLREEYRQLVLLRHFALLSYQEIAELKGMPLGTVKNKLFRAHTVLRKALAEYRRGRSAR